jgi:hypothetical protein
MTTSIILFVGNQFTDLVELTEVDFEEGQQQDDAAVGMQCVVLLTSVNDVTDVFVVFNIEADALSQVNH